MQECILGAKYVQANKKQCGQKGQTVRSNIVFCMNLHTNELTIRFYCVFLT